MQETRKNTLLTHVKDKTLSFFQSYRQKFTDLFLNNSEIIQKEVCSIRQKSSDYFNQIVHIVSTNSHIKNFLKLNKNYYTNYLFSYLGYKYQTNLDNANFYHFVSQAWILNIFPDQTQQEGSSKQYSDILTELVDRNVEDLAIIQSLELITGTFSITDPAIKATEVRLTNIFLKNLRDVISDFRKQEISQNLTKVEFDKIIMDLLLRAVNFTVNESEKIDSQNTLLLYDTFIELSADQANLNITSFIKRVLEKRHISSQQASEDEQFIISASTTFFNFARTSLVDLLYDLDLFNQQSQNLLFILSDIFSRRKQGFQTILTAIYSRFGNLLANVREIRYENLKDFYLNFYSKVKEYSMTSLAIVKKKVNTYKDWVNSIDYVQDALFYPKFYFEKASSYTVGSSIYLYERMYSPCKNITMTVTGDYYNFVLKNVENVRENSKKIYESVVEVLRTKYDKVKENLTHVILYEIQEDVMVFKINKKQIGDIRSQFITSVIEQLSRVKFQENIVIIYEKTKGNVLIIKENLLEKYKKFFNSFSKNEALPLNNKNEEGKNEEEKDISQKNVDGVKMFQKSEDLDNSQNTNNSEHADVSKNEDEKEIPKNHKKVYREKKRKGTIK
jgi:hypothetical protein